MNAQEIAEELESIHWLQDGAKAKPFQHYADFVRQQEAEIESLKDKLMLAKQSLEIVEGWTKNEQ